MIEDLTTDAPSKRAPHRHPFITLFTHPIGSRVYGLLDSLQALESDNRLRWRVQTLFALAVTNTFLSAAIAVSFLCFWLLSRDGLKAAVFAVFVGVTNSALVFGIVPDHFAISLFSLSLGYLLFFWCLERGRIYAPLWALLCVVCFSITSFNVLQPSLLFLLVLYARRHEASRMRLMGKALGCAALFMVLGSLLYWLRSTSPVDERAFSHTLAYTDLGLTNAGFYGVLRPLSLVSTMLRQALVAPLVSPRPAHALYRFPEEQDPNQSVLYFNLLRVGLRPVGLALSGPDRRAACAPIGSWPPTGKAHSRGRLPGHPRVSLHQPVVSQPVWLGARDDSPRSNRYLPLLVALAVSTVLLLVSSRSTREKPGAADRPRPFRNEVPQQPRQRRRHLRGGPPVQPYWHREGPA